MASSDVVGIIDEDQVIELLVTGESDRFECDTLLHAAITREADHIVIKNRVFCGVEAGCGHFGRHRHTDCIANSLSERATGGFNARRFAELRVTRSLRV